MTGAGLLLQPYPRAGGAVFFDEDYAGGLQGGLDERQVAVVRGAGAAFEASDRCQSGAGRLGKVWPDRTNPKPWDG